MPVVSSGRTSAHATLLLCHANHSLAGPGQPWGVRERFPAMDCASFPFVTRFNGLQVWAADLVASAKFYGQFLGLELDDEPHQHAGNEALHYDVAWGDFSCVEYMVFDIGEG